LIQASSFRACLENGLQLPQQAWLTCGQVFWLCPGMGAWSRAAWSGHVSKTGAKARAQCRRTCARTGRASGAIQKPDRAASSPLLA